MVQRWLVHARSQRGQGVAEYALIMALVSVVMVVILLALGTQITNVFSNVVSILVGSSAGLPAEP